MVFQGASLLPADNKQAGCVCVQHGSSRLYPVMIAIHLKLTWLCASLRFAMSIVATAVACTLFFTGYSKAYTTQGNQIRRTFRNSATTTTAPGDCVRSIASVYIGGVLGLLPRNAPHALEFGTAHLPLLLLLLLLPFPCPLFRFLLLLLRMKRAKCQPPPSE